MLITPQNHSPFRRYWGRRKEGKKLAHTHTHRHTHRHTDTDTHRHTHTPQWKLWGDRGLSKGLRLDVFPWWLSDKDSACQCRRLGFDPWVRKIPWRRKQQPTPVFWPGKSHGQRRSLAGHIPWGHRVGHDLVTKLQNLIRLWATELNWMHHPETYLPSATQNFCLSASQRKCGYSGADSLHLGGAQTERCFVRAGNMAVNWFLRVPCRPCCKVQFQLSLLAAGMK